MFRVLDQFGDAFHAAEGLVVEVVGGVCFAPRLIVVGGETEEEHALEMLHGLLHLTSFQVSCMLQLFGLGQVVVVAL